MTYVQTRDDFRIKYQDTLIGYSPTKDSLVIPMRVVDVTVGGGEIFLELRDYCSKDGRSKRVNVNSEKLKLTPPELGMVESLAGISSSYIHRLDKKQYRMGLLTDNIRSCRLSKTEENSLGVRRGAQRGHSPFPAFGLGGGSATKGDRPTPEEILSLFNRKFYERGEAVKLVSEGKALSLPIDYEFGIVQKRFSSTPLLNKRGVDIGRIIPSSNKVVLKRTLAQYREQVEGLGFIVEVK